MNNLIFKIKLEFNFYNTMDFESPNFTHCDVFYHYEKKSLDFKTNFKASMK
jgi:hypothetical protein